MPNTFTPCNLLMIEDNPADVRLMIEAIREAGLSEMVTARYAYDGDEALTLMDSAHNIGEPFHMILLDLNMPKVSGKELLAKIKSDERHLSVLVFIMTNSDYKNDMLQPKGRCLYTETHRFQTPHRFLHISKALPGDKPTSVGISDREAI